jgi:antitoxin VapB
VREEGARSLADRLMEIGKDCAARLKGPVRSADHADLLYDERGLPR